jgi:ADP-ribose pyrophosphatase YjhB (NUDIX family)
VKRLLLQIWRILPFWVQRMASAVLRPHFQVALGGMIFNELGQLLLCEHTYRRQHSWGLPGGDLKPGEDPLDGVRREIREETGLRVQDVRLLLVESSKEIHQVALTYLCSGVSGTFVPNDEVKGIRYIDTGKLPDFFHEHRLTIEKCLAILNSEK